MPFPVHPRTISPRGVIEGTHYVPSGGFALKAIDSRAVCLDFVIVRTRGEYLEALRVLRHLLDTRDPVSAAADFDRGVRRAFARRALDPLLAVRLVR